MVPFLTKREYLSLNNERISKAGRLTLIASRTFVIFFLIFLVYCIFSYLPNPSTAK